MTGFVVLLNRHLDPETGPAAGERRMIGHGKVEFHQLKDRFQKALRLTSRERKDGLHDGHGLNRQIRIRVRGPALAGLFHGRPMVDGLLADPNRETSPFF